MHRLFSRMAFLARLVAVVVLFAVGWIAHNMKYHIFSRGDSDENQRPHGGIFPHAHADAGGGGSPPPPPPGGGY